MTFFRINISSLFPHSNSKRNNLWNTTASNAQQLTINTSASSATNTHQQVTLPQILLHVKWRRVAATFVFIKKLLQQQPCCNQSEMRLFQPAASNSITQEEVVEVSLDRGVRKKKLTSLVLDTLSVRKSLHILVFKSQRYNFKNSLTYIQQNVVKYTRPT